MQYTRASLHHANAELRHRRGRSRSNPVQVKQHILEVTNWMFSKSGVLPIDACPPNLSSELIKRSYQVILSSDQELIKSLSSTYWALNFLLSLSLNHNLSLKLRGLINNWNCFSDRMQPKIEWRSHRLCAEIEAHWRAFGEHSQLQSIKLHSDTHCDDFKGYAACQTLCWPLPMSASNLVAPPIWFHLFLSQINFIRSNLDVIALTVFFRYF